MLPSAWTVKVPPLGGGGGGGWPTVPVPRSALAPHTRHEIDCADEATPASAGWKLQPAAPVKSSHAAIAEILNSVRLVWRFIVGAAIANLVPPMTPRRARASATALRGLPRRIG